MHISTVFFVLSILLTSLNVGATTTYTCHDQTSKTAVKLVVHQNPAQNSFVIDSQTHEFTSKDKQLQIFALYDHLIVQAVSINDPNVFAQMTLELINTQDSEVSTANISTVIRINDGMLHETLLTCLVIAVHE